MAWAIVPTYRIIVPCSDITGVRSVLQEQPYVLRLIFFSSFENRHVPIGIEVWQC